MRIGPPSTGILDTTCPTGGSGPSRPEAERTVSGYSFLSMTTDDLRTSQFTRNELLASRLGQCPVGDMPGTGGQRYFIERRGEGIAVIEDETFSLAGEKPVFELIGERELKLVVPAASPPLPDGIAARIVVRNDESGGPLPGVHVVMIYPNKTYREARTDVFGHADFVLHARLPMTVLCAAPGFMARAASGQVPGGQPLELGMQPAPGAGSLIIANRTGHLLGIQGRLNSILDSLDRTYLYADNVAINDGMQQPVQFRLNEPVRLTDSLGSSATLWFREMVGSSRLPLRWLRSELPSGAQRPAPLRSGLGWPSEYSPGWTSTARTR